MAQTCPSTTVTHKGMVTVQHKADPKKPHRPKKNTSKKSTRTKKNPDLGYHEHHLDDARHQLALSRKNKKPKTVIAYWEGVVHAEQDAIREEQRLAKRKKNPPRKQTKAETVDVVQIGSRQYIARDISISKEYLGAGATRKKALADMYRVIKKYKLNKNNPLTTKYKYFAVYKPWYGVRKYWIGEKLKYDYSIASAKKYKKRSAAVSIMNKLFKATKYPHEVVGVTHDGERYPIAYANPKKNPPRLGVHQQKMYAFLQKYPNSWHGIGKGDGGLTLRVAKSLQRKGLIEINQFNQMHLKK